MLRLRRRSAVAAHGKHFQQGVLRAVVGVLGAALALRNPDVLFLFIDGKVHVAAQPGAAFEHLAHAHRALHDERLVDAHELLDPGIDEQVVADGDFHRRGETVLQQEQAEESRVEHDVTVVRDEGVIADGKALRVEVDGGAGAHDELFDEGIKHAFLDFEVRRALVQAGGQLFAAHAREEREGDGEELRVGQELVEHGGEFFGRVGADFVKFGGNVHGGRLWSVVCVELSFDDVRKDILHFQSGGPYLLGDEACGRHAGRRVDFEQVDGLVPGLAREDVVDADDAVAVEVFVD